MRLRTDTRGLGVVKPFFMLITSASLGLSMGMSFLVVRGPFLGGPSLNPFPMMAALAVSVAGIVVLTWGSTWLLGVGTGA